MNWKETSQSHNAKIYVMPEGWDSAEKVAADLGCSWDRVRVVMSPLIRAKVIESSLFPVWNETTKRIDRVAGYRQIPQADKKPDKKSAKVA